MLIRATSSCAILMLAAILNPGGPARANAGTAPEQTPAAAAALRPFGAEVQPAWQMPGFVMEEVISTPASPIAVAPLAPARPDLGELLELHRREIRIAF